MNENKGDEGIHTRDAERNGDKKHRGVGRKWGKWTDDMSTGKTTSKDWDSCSQAQEDTGGERERRERNLELLKSPVGVRTALHAVPVCNVQACQPSLCHDQFRRRCVRALLSSCDERLVLYTRGRASAKDGFQRLGALVSLTDLRVGLVC